ncbi:BTAD domain-containing putative transcriptional regulator [Actinoplanes sp. NPDC051513]|uniref:BTAD domain-containing putative transcriptional regulator n=1 Tax=Actinoplanes sp. NPDC051513 TaxID=3363908 RepID=UPI0037AD77C2
MQILRGHGSQWCLVHTGWRCPYTVAEVRSSHRESSMLPSSGRCRSAGSHGDFGRWLEGNELMKDEQVSEAARRQAARYGRQQSLWAAPGPDPKASANGKRRTGQVIRSAMAAALLLGGPPWLLWTAIGNPVSVWSSWWSSGPFTAASSPEAGLRTALILAGWLVWLVLVVLLTGSVAGVLRGRRLPRWRLPMPLHRLVAGLTGTATVALVASPAAAAATPSPAVHADRSDGQDDSAPAVPLWAPAATSSLVERGTGDTEGTTTRAGTLTVRVGHARFDYRVRRGDTLSKVAKIWLGDPDRWPEVCRLNKHHHFGDGRELTDCDLIYPGWEIRLPADATPPQEATPTGPSRTPARSAEPPEQDQPPSAAPPAATPSRTLDGPSAEAGSRTVPAPPAANPAEDNGARQPTGSDLVLPGGSVLPWALACAITATAALVWLQRRRRYKPGTADDDLLDLPAPVLAAQHHTGHAIAPPPPSESAATWRLPTGGVGVIGPAADAAVRGLIVTALTSGAPTDPAQQAEVIIDQDTLTLLVGERPITGWPRLRITGTLEQTLTLLDTHLLRRARILDEHDLSDIETLRDVAPSEESLPPLLVIAHAEQAAGSSRARITYGLTHGLDVTVVVLGHWPHGPSVSVSDDGHARTEPDSPQLPTTRLPVLDATTTRELLDTAREAHTGQPPPSSARPVPPSSAAAATADPAATASPTASRPESAVPETSTGIAAPKRARLRVLGKARIEDITAEGRPLRAKALELAVFLAVHPDGASTRDIGEYLEPDARISQADQRVHTNASNLRHVLGRAGDAEAKNAYVIKSSGKYRLDPDTVDIDLWTLRDLLRAASTAPSPRRRELLSSACTLYTGPLADGSDYEWLAPHRETVRRWGTDAHLLLAEELLATEPQTASDLLDKAIALDRYNEALYVKAMHARHAIGDSAGIRTLLRVLTKALSDLNAEPNEETTALAARLPATSDEQ